MNRLTLAEYITLFRLAARKSTTKTRNLWATRVVAPELHRKGRAGAEEYLLKHGKGIAAFKAIDLAVHAEREGCPDFAMILWEKAYAIWHTAFTRTTGRAASAA